MDIHRGIYGWWIRMSIIYGKILWEWNHWYIDGVNWCVLARLRNKFVSGVTMASPVNLHNRQMIWTIATACSENFTDFHKAMAICLLCTEHFPAIKPDHHKNKLYVQWSYSVSNQEEPQHLKCYTSLQQFTRFSIKYFELFRLIVTHKILPYVSI